MTLCRGREALSVQGNLARAKLLAVIRERGATTVQALSLRVRYKARFVDSLLRSGYTINGYRFVQAGIADGRVLWGVEAVTEPAAAPPPEMVRLLGEIEELTDRVSWHLRAGQPEPAQQAISLVLQKRDELAAAKAASGS